MGTSRIVNVTADNSDKYGFFCLMSRKKSEDYRKNQIGRLGRLGKTDE
jgi:hypothetical protein